MEPNEADFMGLYEVWQQLGPGPRAELRRVASPENLFETPVYYRIIRSLVDTHGRRAVHRLQNLVFCLPFVRHTDRELSLGTALAAANRQGKPAVSEKRLFQILRSEPPNDMIQLRRILKMTDPAVKWPAAARLLWYWNERSKRELLEDFFLGQSR